MARFIGSLHEMHKSLVNLLEDHATDPHPEAQLQHGVEITHRLHAGMQLFTQLPQSTDGTLKRMPSLAAELIGLIPQLRQLGSGLIYRWPHPTGISHNIDA